MYVLTSVEVQSSYNCNSLYNGVNLAPSAIIFSNTYVLVVILNFAPVSFAHHTYTAKDTAHNVGCNL